MDSYNGITFYQPNSLNAPVKSSLPIPVATIPVNPFPIPDSIAKIMPTAKLSWSSEHIESGLVALPKPSYLQKLWENEGKK